MKTMNLKKTILLIIFTLYINSMRIGDQKKNRFPKIPKKEERIMKPIKITRFSRSKMTKEKNKLEINKFVK